MKRKILVIASWGDSLINFRGPLLSALIDGGHEVVTSAPNIPTNTLEALHLRGVEFHSIKLDRTGANPFKDIISLASIYRLVKKVQPDTTLAYTAKPVIYGSLASKLAGVNDIYAIITGLGSTFIYENAKNRILRPLLEGLYGVALRCNRMIFFQNKDDLFEFRKNIRFRPRQQFALVNGSGVDLEYFRQQPMPENLSFLLAARLISDKGVLEYANAARYLKNRYPYIKFFLAGWFDQTPYAIKEALVTEWQQEGTIEFLGHVEDIREALKNTSVFVLPSLREGTPRSVLEAMASGRPIITTDAPGCRETVREGINGFLIPPKNEYALRARMEEFVKRPGLLPVMGEASRKIAEEKFDVQVVNDIIIKGMQL